MAGSRKRKAVHDDHATPNTETKKPASKRKKQGVTKTNSAAVKALIRQNQANSPLLRLAPEIREKILTYFVGDQVVHICHIDGAKFDKDILPGRRNEKSDGGSALIVHLICQANTLEANDYHEAHKHEDDDSAESSGSYFVESRKQFHRYCEQAITVKNKRRKLQLDLGILGASRQCYEEANHLLWSTNTFTFDHPRAFDLFFSSLNPAQKRNVNNLSFFATIDPWCRVGLLWKHAFRATNLRMLQGLQNLAFYFDMHHQWTLYADYDTVKSELTEELETFLAFRMIPLKQVTVSISDGPRLIKEHRCSSARLTAAEKDTVAREWEIKLLDADPASTIEAEENAKELHAAESVRKYWELVIKSQEDNLGARRADLGTAAAGLEAAEIQLGKIPPHEKERDRYKKNELRETVVEMGTILDDTIRLLKSAKANIHHLQKKEASRRQEEREKRMRQWEACKPRSAA